MRRFGILLLAASACGDTGQRELTLPAQAQSELPREFSSGAWTVRLDRAELGFGPAYFCAAANADADLCSVAVAELRAVRPIDLLDPAPQPLGALAAVTDTARSVIFDYAISWSLTERDPTPGSGAPSGHSLVFAGTAQQGELVRRFEGAIDVTPLSRGSFRASRRLTPQALSESTRGLTVRFAPEPWFAALDLAALLSAPGEELRVETQTTAVSALIGAMTSTHLPTFEWQESP